MAATPADAVPTTNDNPTHAPKMATTAKTPFPDFSIVQPGETRNAKMICNRRWDRTNGCVDQVYSSMRRGEFGVTAPANVTPKYMPREQLHEGVAGERENMV